jgi:hypothetical protein
MAVTKRRAYASQRRASSRSAQLGALRRKRMNGGYVPPRTGRSIPRGQPRPMKRFTKRKIVGSRTFLKSKTTLGRYKRARPEALIPYKIERHQGIRNERPDDDPDVGAVSLGYYIINYGDVNAGTSTVFPMMLADLTVIRQAALVPAVLHQCRILDNGQAGFLPQQCQDAAGGNFTTTWQDEDVRHGALGTATMKRAQIVWWDIRLKLYGCRKQSVKYTVSLIKFKREYMDWTVNPAASNELEQKAAFYQGMVRRLTQNTILPVNNDWKRFVTILRSKTVNIDSGSSDELDRNPPTVDLKWFIRDGKMRTYAESADRHATDIATFGVNWNVRTAANVSVHCPPRDRVYLMIQATDMTPASTDIDQDQDSTPSFDLLIRRRLNMYSIDG